MIQEVFGFLENRSFDWRDFIESNENHEAVSYLMKWPNWIGNGIIIFGDSGVGKTHLANLWKQTAGAEFVSKSSLSCYPRQQFNQNCHFVFDDFDEFLAENRDDWIFHFFNIAKEKKRFYILISQKHPSGWNIRLDDLRSRLFTLGVIRMKNPGYELLVKISQKISRDLGIKVSEETLRCMLNLVDRVVTTVSNVLATLNKLALQLQKDITTSFVKKYLDK
jgi:chromosomal replication initiation ATPase DnaA